MGLRLFLCLVVVLVHPALTRPLQKRLTGAGHARSKAVEQVYRQRICRAEWPETESDDLGCLSLCLEKANSAKAANSGVDFLRTFHADYPLCRKNTFHSASEAQTEEESLEQFLGERCALHYRNDQKCQEICIAILEDLDSCGWPAEPGPLTSEFLMECVARKDTSCAPERVYALSLKPVTLKQDELITLDPAARNRFRFEQAIEGGSSTEEETTSFLPEAEDTPEGAATPGNITIEEAEQYCIDHLEGKTGRSIGKCTGLCVFHITTGSRICPEVIRDLKDFKECFNRVHSSLCHLAN